jgi:hypothetical protein
MIQKINVVKEDFMGEPLDMRFSVEGIFFSGSFCAIYWLKKLMYVKSVQFPYLHSIK